MAYSKFRWSSATSASVNSIFSALASGNGSLASSIIRSRMFDYAPHIVLSAYAEEHYNGGTRTYGEPLVSIDVSAIHNQPEVLAIGFWLGSDMDIDPGRLTGTPSLPRDGSNFITTGEPWDFSTANLPQEITYTSFGGRRIYTPHIGETFHDEPNGERCIVNTRYYEKLAFDKIGLFTPIKCGRAALFVISEGNI